jgi:hypothetical protein
MKLSIIGLCIITLLLGANIVGAENRIQIDVAMSGIAYDTMYVGGAYELRFLLENDFVVGGMGTGIKIWSDDGATWRYLSQPEGIGNSGYFTIVPGSRMDDNPFDMTGLLITEYDIDLQGTDLLLWGGVGMINGLQPGPLEHMVSMHFSPTAPLNPDEIHTLCFDTGMVPPPSPFIWTYLDGYAISPEWGGQLCVPVKFLCGNPNGDNDVNVGDAVFMINHVFREGPPPDPWQLGDANCDGTLDVGDIVFLVAAAFRFGPQPECCEYRR